MVSKHDHCLNDLLYRYRTVDLAIEIPVIISNHPDLEELAKWHRIPYFHLPISKEIKIEQEVKVWQIIPECEVDLVVLASCMQVLSNDMRKKLSGKAINIYHLLLPGFKVLGLIIKFIIVVLTQLGLPRTMSVMNSMRAYYQPRC